MKRMKNKKKKVRINELQKGERTKKQMKRKKS